MTPRLLIFVIWIACFGCGNANGNGAQSIYCGTDGSCPSGMLCASNKFCVSKGSAADVGVGDSTADSIGVGADSAAETGGTDASAGDGGSEVGAGDAGTDAAAETAGKDAEVVDVPKEDTGPVLQSVTAIQEDPKSSACADLDKSVDSASDVALETVVATSSAIKLKNSNGTYSNSFFAAPLSANADGKWSGIQVIVGGDPFAINIGDTLNLTGTIKEFFCMTEIYVKPENAIVTGSTAEPKAYNVQMSMLDVNGAEAYEGVLIRISAVQVTDPNPLGSDGKTHGEATISHNGGAVSIGLAPAIGSSYLSTSTGGTVTTFSSGQGFASVTGNLQWSFGHWVLRARSDADIVLK